MSIGLSFPWKLLLLISDITTNNKIQKKHSIFVHSKELTSERETLNLFGTLLVFFSWICKILINKIIYVLIKQNMIALV